MLITVRYFVIILWWRFFIIIVIAIITNCIAISFFIDFITIASYFVECFKSADEDNSCAVSGETYNPLTKTCSCGTKNSCAGIGKIVWFFSGNT